MPMRPPSSDRVSASTRNWARMSRPTRADRLADADLAGPLADRDQHDVHDPDAADDQRDRGDPAEQQRQRGGDRRRRLEQLGLVEDVEVGGVGGRQLVPVTEQRGDLGARRGHPVGVGDGDADRPDGVAADEILLDDADRDDDLVVGILEPGPALGLEDADDPERQAADRDLRAEVAGAEPERGRGRRAEDGDAQVLVEARRRSGTCPARRRRRGPSGRPGSCRRPWSWHSSCRP